MRPQECIGRPERASAGCAVPACLCRSLATALCTLPSRHSVLRRAAAEARRASSWPAVLPVFVSRVCRQHCARALQNNNKQKQKHKQQQQTLVAAHFLSADLSGAFVLSARELFSFFSLSSPSFCLSTFLPFRLSVPEVSSGTLHDFISRPIVWRAGPKQKWQPFDTLWHNWPPIWSRRFVFSPFSAHSRAQLWPESGSRRSSAVQLLHYSAKLRRDKSGSARQCWEKCGRLLRKIGS